MKTFQSTFVYVVCLLSLAGVACLACHYFGTASNGLLVAGVALTGLGAFLYPLVMACSGIVRWIQGAMHVKEEDQIDL